MNREAGQRGYCQAGAKPRVFRYGPHFGEEPPLTGSKGSGAIFFSHCTMHCLYCQNHPWSQGGKGDDLTVEQLRAIFKELAEKGCHNWNLVSPTPWLPAIREAVTPLIRAGISLPFVYNTSGFESTEALDLYPDLADIALIDLRYSRGATAAEASGAPGYVESAREAMRWFWNKLGPLELDDNGLARRGVICRLLVLPGHAVEAAENLEWLWAEIGTDVAVSVMAQYTPVFTALERDGWKRKINREEYELVTDTVERLGFENGWIQDFEGEAPADLLGQAMPAGEGAVGAGVMSAAAEPKKETK